MTTKEVFCDLMEKYGDDFTRGMIPFSDNHFVKELENEIGKDNDLCRLDALGRGFILGKITFNR